MGAQDFAGLAAIAANDDAAAAIPRRYNFAEDILTRNLAAGRAGKTAYIDPRGSWTYGQLGERVARFGKVDKVHGGLTLDPAVVEQKLRSTATNVPCPAQNPFVYPGLPDHYTAVCEGTAERNGFYGDGVVNAAAIIRGR